MAFPTPQLQILSDLHLETPVSNPQYETFKLNVFGTALILLGDIGLAKDDRLFTFLRRLLDQNRGSHVFYILGNHEAYGTTRDEAISLMRQFEKEAKQDFGGRFHFLFRNRYDLTDQITILGCTLWSNIDPSHAPEIQSRLTDFNAERGINSWTIEAFQEEHEKDVSWLNAQVEKIQTHEPHRDIVIATHHCPTMDVRATAPVHQGSPMNSAFVSDLSSQLCWTSPSVKVWAFGHTHYSCSFRDEPTAKVVISNQRGYNAIGAAKSRSPRVALIEPKGGEWQVASINNAIRQEKPSEKLDIETGFNTMEIPRGKGDLKSCEGEVEGRQDLSRRPLHQRVAARFRTMLRFGSRSPD